MVCESPRGTSRSSGQPRCNLVCLSLSRSKAISARDLAFFGRVESKSVAWRFSMLRLDVALSRRTSLANTRSQASKPPRDNTRRATAGRHNASQFMQKIILSKPCKHASPWGSSPLRPPIQTGSSLPVAQARIGVSGSHATMVSHITSAGKRNVLIRLAPQQKRFKKFHKCRHCVS